MKPDDFRLTRDPEHGAVYVKLADAPVARTISLSDSVMVDVDAAGNPLGVEVLCLLAPGNAGVAYLDVDESAYRDDR